MTKADLIKSISAETNISKEQTSAILESFFDCVKTSVANGENVYFRGFGTFENVLRHAKNFHAAPGKIIPIPEHYEVRLRFSKFVKGAIK